MDKITETIKVQEKRETGRSLEDDDLDAIIGAIQSEAGKMTQFAAASLLETEDDADTELSPEQSGFMATLKTRYENNEHGIACHSVAEWSKIEAKLRANPGNLDTLKSMEESGGAPDVYKVEGDDFIFGDLSSKAPEGRRDVNYQWAVKKASQMGEGCKLMHPNDYLLLGNDLGIAMDEDPEWVWLNSEHRSDLLEADDALYGVQHNGFARMRRIIAYRRNSYGGFRCSLRV